MRTRGCVLLLILCFLSPSRAFSNRRHALRTGAREKSHSENSKEASDEWLVFGTYFTTFIQPSNGGNSNSALLTWSPVIRLSRDFSLIPDLGFMPLNTSAHTFFVYILDVRSRLQLFQSFEIDLSVGVQNWTAGEGGAIFSIGPDLTYHFESPVFGIIKTIRGGAQSVFHPEFQTYQFLFGFEWGLGEI